MQPVKKIMSRKKGPLLTLNGLTIAIEPITIDVMKDEAPKVGVNRPLFRRMSFDDMIAKCQSRGMGNLPTTSPTAKVPLPAPTAENVLKMSGDALPNARKVTPAWSEESRSKRKRGQLM